MINHFNFRKFKDKILITNDFGRYMFLELDEFQKFLSGKTDKDSEEYQKLVDDHFLIERPSELLHDQMKIELRDMKNYTLSGTCLHIFAITNSCNVNCIYCQAKDKSSCLNGFMTIETARKAVDLALQSPSNDLTFEIQGGEPLLNFEVVKEIIEYTEMHKGDKNIYYTLVSNLVALNEEKLDYLISKNVSVCTSLDGPRNVQENNRKCKSGESTFDYAVKGIKLLREKNICGGAIQTTTRYSLDYPEEIVNTYYELGLPGVFIRALTPLGFAKADWDRIGYTPKEFLAFYRKAFDRIIEINKQGASFPEIHATYFLRKIMMGYSYNYMELRSPCGASIGQLSYYYDGSVYTCDEGRMVSEADIKAFKLGNVYDNTYDELMSTPICKSVALSSVAESLPSCNDCAYQPYCGVCPILSYVHDGDIFPTSPQSYRCEIYSGMMDIYFEKLYSGDEDVIRIFRSWLENE